MITDLSLKANLIQACREHLENKVASLLAVMKDLSEATALETKSTAGDKHETSRAMMQLEQEKTGRQLREAEQQLAEFLKTDFQKEFTIAASGSLIHTDKGWFLIAASVGKINTADGKSAFAISVNSPLAKVLTGSKQKDTVLFNGVSYTIQSVC